MSKRDSIYLCKKIGDRLLTQWQVRILLEISYHACNRLIFSSFLKKSELISAVWLAGWLGALDLRTGKR
jgi:hypothetical protein